MKRLICIFLGLLLSVFSGCQDEPFGSEKLRLIRSSHDVQTYYRNFGSTPIASELPNFEADGIIAFREGDAIDFAIFLQEGKSVLILFQTDFFVIGESEVNKLRPMTIGEAKNYLMPHAL